MQDLLSVIAISAASAAISAAGAGGFASFLLADFIYDDRNEDRRDGKRNDRCRGIHTVT